MTNGSLMKVESNAECSPWSILQYFWPALSDNWSWKTIFGSFSSGHFRQVLLYVLLNINHIVRLYGNFQVTITLETICRVCRNWLQQIFYSNYFKIADSHFLIVCLFVYLIVYIPVNIFSHVGMGLQGLNQY